MPTLVVEDAVLNQLGDLEHDGEARRGRRPEGGDADAELLGDLEGPPHVDVADEPPHLGPPGRLYLPDERLQVPRHVAGVGVDELAKVLAVLVVGQPVRYVLQVDAAQRLRRGGVALGQRREHEHVVHLCVDEGDLEAVVDEAVRELHERGDVALARHGQHQHVALRHGWPRSVFLSLSTHRSSQNQQQW